ncbi:hypothetical protein [Chelativorans alearense]|uniref:hypothetical protein n=1 Tax=Chelativorans alearense TaxID=2681495 RepID=UPI0013D6579E|nr:hypothetical protein [Chelativorans alearense]
MRDATILAQPGARELPQAHGGSRTRLVRRVVLFQVKLFADGLRDFVMSPLSIIAGVLGILFSRDPEGAYDRLMRFGRETDRWINLFRRLWPGTGRTGPDAGYRRRRDRDGHPARLCQWRHERAQRGRDAGPCPAVAAPAVAVLPIGAQPLT